MKRSDDSFRALNDQYQSPFISFKLIGWASEVTSHSTDRAEKHSHLIVYQKKLMLEEFPSEGPG